MLVKKLRPSFITICIMLRLQHAGTSTHNIHPSDKTDSDNKENDNLQATFDNIHQATHNYQKSPHPPNTPDDFPHISHKQAKLINPDPHHSKADSNVPNATIQHSEPHRLRHRQSWCSTTFDSTDDAKSKHIRSGTTTAVLHHSISVPDVPQLPLLHD